MSLDFDVFPESDVIVDAQDLSLREQRSLIFMLLYAAHLGDYDVSLESIVDNFSRGFNIRISFRGKIFEWTSAIIDNRDSLDAQMAPFLAHWRLERIGVCTKLILRMALWELQNTDTPHTVVINEAVELAKSFAELESYKFINGVLDEFVKTLPSPVSQ